MNTRRLTLPSPNPMDATGIVSWVHFGDLHMTNRAEANCRDFASLVEEVNQVLKTSLNFAYLPGDIAEHGAPHEYEAFREVIDRLQLPWFATVADHDVHQRTQKSSRHGSQLETEDIVGPWPETSLLGTQLGPNKNGRKW
jgi:3',5'-cyclic-AMP phosphodiesterase